MPDILTLQSSLVGRLVSFYVCVCVCAIIDTMVDAMVNTMVDAVVDSMVDTSKIKFFIKAVHYNSPLYALTANVKLS